MKLPLAALAFVLWAGSAAAAPPPEPTDVAAVTNWLSGLGPRREGSDAENAVFAALRTWLGPTAERTDFEGLEGEHSFSHRLTYRVAGRDRGELVVVAPTDGANDVGLAWAVVWACRAASAGSTIPLTFYFTGAERGTSNGLGSRAFLQDFYPTAPAAVLYLDAQAVPRVELTAESGLYPSPLWMVRGLTEALDAAGLPPQFVGTAPSLFRLDLPERENALAPWFDRSFPALLINAGPASNTVVDALQSFVSGLSTGVPNYWDRHYLVFDLGFTRFFWSQAAYLSVLLGVAAVLLFGYALAGRGRRGSLRILRKGAWQIPVLFAFLFLSLSAGTLFSTWLQEARGLPDFWRTDPLVVWLFKAFAAVSLYLVLFLPFRRSPLSTDPDFYGQAALLWLGIMVLVAAALELTFSFYFLWALVWCAVLVVFPWPPLRFLAMAAGPLWLVKAAWDILGPQPDLALSQWVLSSPVAGNVALAVLFFPFMLQVNAWHFSGRSHQNRDDGMRAAVHLTLWGLAALVSALVLLQIPARTAASAQAPARVDLVATPRPELWRAQVTRTGFLDRTVWTIRFEGEAPDHVEFTLRSQETLTIFDSNFPVSLAADGREARLVVGRQPPVPLTLRLTLPSVSAELLVQAVFPGSPGIDARQRLELRP